MFKRFYTMFLQNLTLAFRNTLVWVILGTLVIMIALVRFVIPSDYDVSQQRYYLDRTPGKQIEAKLKERGITEGYFVNDRESLEKAVEKKNDTVGIIFEGTYDKPSVALIHHGKLSEQSSNVAKVSIEKLIMQLSGKTDDGNVEIEFLRDRLKPVPKNLSTVPVLMVFEVLILGFLLVAVFIFQEKSDGSIKAYRVTPGGAPMYILSKTAAFLVLGVVYGLALMGFTAGFNVNYFLLLTIIILGFVLYTHMGLIVAIFFNSISEWFLVGISVLAINLAPAISHEYPAFSPAALTWFPSYQIIFGIDEIMFPSGKSLFSLIITLLVENIVVYVICYLLVKRKLMKEGR